jgi:HEPN domain-containing protein
LELCAELTEWPETISNAEELTPFAITTRYPGEDERVTKKEALKAIDIAVNVRKIVRSTLKREGFMLKGY